MNALPRSFRAQAERRNALGAARAHRVLTDAEQRELDRLESAFYQREWRARQRENERKLVRNDGYHPASSSAAIGRTEFTHRALSDVARVRAEQVVRFGHSLAADDARDLGEWAVDLRHRAKHLHETLQVGHRSTARAQAVRLAAYAIALVDRLDRDMQETP